MTTETALPAKLVLAQKKKKKRMKGREETFQAGATNKKVEY